MGFDDGFATPENFNIVNADDGPKRTTNVEPVNTCPVTGGALSTNVTNPISIRDGEDCSIKATVYDSMPASGVIASGDNPQLVVAPIYGRNDDGDVVPLETAYSSANGGEYRLKVDAEVTSEATSVAIHDGVDLDIRATAYESVPTSGEISSADNPQLVVAPIYGHDDNGNIVPLETIDSGDGYRLKVDADITDTDPVTSVALNDGINHSVRATVYDSMPASGMIASGDNPQLVVAPIYGQNEEGTIVPLETTESSGENRLLVNAIVTGVETNVQRYRPRVYESTTPISFTVTDEVKTAYTFSGDGQIDIIAVKTEDVNFSIILEVDGVEIYEIALAALQSTFKFVGGDASGISTFSFDTGKGFADVYNTPIDFTEDFTVKVRKTGAPNKSVSGVFVRYRIKII